MRRLFAIVLAIVMVMSFTACGSTQNETKLENKTPNVRGVEDGILTVGMECAYAPYNWSQLDDADGAVPIANAPGTYANGYDVIIAKKICETYGWQLEVMQIGWDGLTPALNAGTIDAVIAGQSMTADRKAEVDMAGPYYYASILHYRLIT